AFRSPAGQETQSVPGGPWGLFPGTRWDGRRVKARPVVSAAPGAPCLVFGSGVFGGGGRSAFAGREAADDQAGDRGRRHGGGAQQPSQRHQLGQAGDPAGQRRDLVSGLRGAFADALGRALRGVLRGRRGVLDAVAGGVLGSLGGRGRGGSALGGAALGRVRAALGGSAGGLARGV